MVTDVSTYPPVPAPVISNAIYVNTSASVGSASMPLAKRARINNAAAVHAVMDAKMEAPRDGGNHFLNPTLEFPQQFNPQATHRSASGGHIGGSEPSTQIDTGARCDYMRSGGSSPLGPESPGAQWRHHDVIESPDAAPHSPAPGGGKGKGKGKGKGPTKHRSPKPSAPPKAPEEWERIAQEAAVVVFARLEVSS